MATGAVTSIGTVFQYSDGATSPSFTTLARVSNIAFDGGEVAFDDTTDLSDIYNTRIATNIDEGRLTLDLIYEPGETGLEAMYTDRAARTRRDYKVVYQDTGNMEHSFSGYVVSISKEAGVGTALRGSIAIQIDGAVTRTP